MKDKPGSRPVLDLYDDIIASIPGVQRKGATMPYTSLNGHMFSFIDKADQMSLRLPAGEREVFLAKHRTTLSFQNNTVMKEYVVVPDKLLEDLEVMKAYFGISYRYVAGLKAKNKKKK